MNSVLRIAGLINYLFLSFFGFGQFPPAANLAGTTAIHKDSSIIKSWATAVHEFTPGFEDIALGGALVSHGDSTEALGLAEGNSSDVVSLGDAGEIVLTFLYPIRNGSGPDFAVFENSFSHDYLELAHVEVSTDGFTFVRLPSISQVQTITQTGSFGSTQTQSIHNLAGKYIQAYGTPFDLEDILDSTGINLDSINYVKIIDVVGSIDPAYASYDSQGTIINEPYPSAFASGGFDLDAVAVINENNGSVSLNTLNDNFNVYPNPSKGIVYVSSYTGVYHLVDMRGNVVSSGFVKLNESIDFGDQVSRGIYVLKLENESIRLMINP